MSQAEPTRPSRLPAELKLALGLSALFLLVSAAGFLESLIFMSGANHVLKSMEVLRLIVSPTGRMVAGYALFVIAGHALLGLLIWWSALGLWRRAAASGAPLRLFVLAAWVAWVLALLLANAALAPWSDAARFFRDFATLGPGPVAVWHLALVLALTTAWPSTLDGLSALRTRLASATSRRRRLALGVGLASVAVLGATSLHAPLRVQPAVQDRPNIILIGVDSLRLPWVDAFGGTETPHIGRFVSEAALFEWSYSPLARTFGAWMSLLSGQYPRTNGVRLNVMPPESYADIVTVADRLRDAGWHTVFAMDEMRFAPIDEDLGFDQVIGPPIGAHDFLLATIADLPLTNVLADTGLGRWLLPGLHANRTAAVSYHPESFDRLLWDELEVDRPLFLAVHFTLPHHPIFWADAPRTYEYFPRPDVGDSVLLREQLYRAATREVDAQVGRFLAEAERRGLLRDAIVVMLSDHGEAVGLPEDDGLRVLHAPPGVRGVVFTNSRRGHGSATTAPTQFETLLAFRRYGGGERWQGRLGVQTSLIDVAPTLLGLTGLPADPAMDGADLGPLLRGEPTPPGLRRRLLFTETGYNPTTLRVGGEPDERKLFLESLNYYRVDPTTGRIAFRPEQMPFLIRLKERAAIASPWILSAVPSIDSAQTLWMLYNRDTGDWVRYPEDLALLPGRPPAAQLEAALLDHYGEELAPPRVWPAERTVREGEPLPEGLTEPISQASRP